MPDHAGALVWILAHIQHIETRNALIIGSHHQLNAFALSREKRFKHW
jgi:hypothetical protein